MFSIQLHFSTWEYKIPTLHPQSCWQGAGKIFTSFEPGFWRISSIGLKFGTWRGRPPFIVPHTYYVCTCTTHSTFCENSYSLHSTNYILRKIFYRGDCNNFSNVKFPHQNSDDSGKWREYYTFSLPSWSGSLYWIDRWMSYLPPGLIFGGKHVLKGLKPHHPSTGSNGF